MAYFRKIEVGFLGNLPGVDVVMLLMESPYSLGDKFGCILILRHPRTRVGG
jgi:hypothetical protein